MRCSRRQSHAAPQSATASALAQLRDMVAEAQADIDRADSKASILTGALGIGFSALALFSAGNGQLLVSLSDVARITWIAGVGLAGCATVFSGVAIWPRLVSEPGERVATRRRLKENRRRSSLPATEMVVYWRDAARAPTPADLQAWLELLGERESDRMTREFWRLSKTIRAKYYWVRAALVSGGLSVVVLALIVVLALFGTPSSPA